MVVCGYCAVSPLNYERQSDIKTRKIQNSRAGYKKQAVLDVLVFWEQPFPNDGNSLIGNRQIDVDSLEVFLISNFSS